MKIYLYSRYSRRDQLRAIRNELVSQGHTITSRWLDTAWNEAPDKAAVSSSAAPPEYREEYAMKDLEDVVGADCIVAFTEEPRSGGRGGRHVEFGIELALSKRLIVVGYRENIFYYHPRVEFCTDVVDLLQLLSR